MKQQRLDVIRANEGEHFWFTARHTIVADACRRLTLPTAPVVVDVGCGTGHTLSTLFPAGTAFGIDLLTPHVVESGSQPRLRGSVESLPIDADVADLVLALDVLEHVDDAQALAEVRRILRPGGYLVATVPAYQSLWSYRDVDAGHRRRYRRPSLRAALVTGGFSIQRCSYFHGALLPALAVARIAGRNRPKVRDLEDRPPAVINRLFSTISRGEAALAVRGLRAPAGSSLLAIAQGPDH